MIVHMLIIGREKEDVKGDKKERRKNVVLSYLYRFARISAEDLIRLACGDPPSPKGKA